MSENAEMVRRFITRRRTALRLAKREYDNAVHWDDWRQRSVLFRAMDLFDTDTDPRAESAFYLVQDHLKVLNACDRFHGGQPCRPGDNHPGAA